MRYAEVAILKRAVHVDFGAIGRQSIHECEDGAQAVGEVQIMLDVFARIEMVDR